MKYYSVQEIRDLEQAAFARGVTAAELMQRAGQSAAEHIIQGYPLVTQPKVCVLCGKGNNAGDGFVVAHCLTEVGYDVSLVLVEIAAYAEPAHTYWLKVSMLPCVLLSQQARQARELIMAADLVIDAMLGIGFNGELHPTYRDAVCALNLSGKKIIALDVPTGVHGDKGVSSPFYVRPTETLTFIAPKLAMCRDNPEAVFGRITVLDIGI
jgi:NAD(P)H-hydrate epimerase